MPAKGYRVDPKQRFTSKVRRDRWDHWRWQGHKTPNGYGTFMIGGGHRGRLTTAHRAAWELFRGEIPEGRQIHHVCAVRSCVNPEHLAVTTPQENSQERSTRNGRKSHCKHGHAMEDDNVIWRVRGRDGYLMRLCRACRDRQQREYYQRQHDGLSIERVRRTT